MAREPDHDTFQGPALLLGALAQLLPKLYGESRAAAWGISRVQFGNALERSARKRFAEGTASVDGFKEYLETLYLEDLGLACACMHGSEKAWEYFVREYQGFLRAAAVTITKGSRGGTDGLELADSLFADLFGLVDGKRGERSLFRYFHGRSSLKTWLRAVLAQRHVDKIRENRRWQPLPERDGEPPKILSTSNLSQPALDPHREKLLARFLAALEDSVNALDPNDHRRVELYYARQKTLAETGRLLGEHESSVSRNLDRIRRELRARVEEHLRTVTPVAEGTPCLTPLSEVEIALCFEYAAEEVPIDFSKLFPEETSGRPSAGSGRKEMP